MFGILAVYEGTDRRKNGFEDILPYGMLYSKK